MVLMSLLRLSGIVILLASLMAMIVMGVNGGVMAGVLPGMVVLLGLWMAVAGDRGMDRWRVEREQAQKRDAETFREASLTTGLRWVRWFLMTGFLAGLVYFAAVIGLKETWRDGAYGVFMVMLALSFLLIVGLSGLLSQAWQVVRAGHLLHLDVHGFAHAALPVISWSDVQGADLREEEVRRGVKNRYLVLALNKTVWERLRPAGWERFVNWMAPRVDAQRPVLSMHCNWAQIPAATLLEATKRIADSSGAPRIKSWHQFEPIESAMAREALHAEAMQADQRVAQLLLKLQRFSRSSAVSSDDVKTLDIQLQRAMNEAGRARDAHFEHVVTSIESSMDKFKQSLLGLYLGLGFVALAIAVSTVYAWMK